MNEENDRLKKAVLKIGGPEKSLVILEAAGKIDAIDRICLWHKINSIKPGGRKDKWVALLEALPGKEEK